MASFHTEFSLESVRQYMLMKDGQVTNHELVKHFKHWLTHPTQSEISRQKFKEYVNTLATIKQVNGEKYLVLKQKFFPRFDDDPGEGLPAPPPPPPSAAAPPPQEHRHPPPPPPSFSSEPSLLDEVMAGLSQPLHGLPQRGHQPGPPPPPTQPQLPSRRVLPPLPNAEEGAVSSRGGHYPHQQNPQVPHSRSQHPPPPPQQQQLHQRSSYASLAPAPYHKNTPNQPQGPPLPPYRPPPPGPPGYQHHRGGGSAVQPPPPPPPSHHGQPPSLSGEYGLPLPSEYGLPQPRQGVFHPPPPGHPDPYHSYQQSPPTALPSSAGPPPLLQRRSPPEPLPPPPPLPAGLPPGMSHPSGLPGMRPPHPQQQPHSRRESVSSSSQLSRSSSAMSINQQQYQQHLPGMTGPGGLPPPQHQPRGSGQPMGQGPNQQQQQQHPSMPPPAAAALPPQRQLSRSELSGGDGVSPSGSSVVSRKNSSEDNKENSHSSGGGSRGDRAGSIESTTATDGGLSAANRPSSSMSSLSGSVGGRAQHQATRQSRDEKISVKERTKTFNRLCSEVDLAALKQAGGTGSTGTGTDAASSVKRRNSTTTNGHSRKSSSVRGRNGVGDGDESQDSSSISTLDTHVKAWMVKSAQADYHAMLKMLRDDPKLAKHKDFVSGFTALHWACKHGNMDLVKLLAGNYGVPVNIKSHGGYTPLHMACQHGHQDVFEILVKAYGADPNVRDNSGKKARQYMVQDQAQSMGLSLSSDTFRQLKDRRSQRRMTGKAHSASGAPGGMTRFGSLSVKVKKTTEAVKAFNSYFNSKMGSDSADSASSSQPSSLGPVSLPMDFVHTSGMSSSSLTSTSMPINQGGGRSTSDAVDSRLMPPPQGPASGPGPSMGLKKRKSSKKGYTEYGRHASAPSTPTPHGQIKEESTEEVRKASLAGSSGGHQQQAESDSDSEFGFGSQWGAPPRR